MKNICVVCNKEFEAIRTTKKYCSKECENKARIERLKQKKNNDKKCLLCGEIFILKSSYATQRMCCYNCMPEGTQLTRGMFLAKIKQLRGGACVRCGYNKCMKALEFHHIDPTKKDFTISNDHFKLIEALEESKKCILLCSNCHKEFHDNLWKLEDLTKEEVEPCL